MEVLLQEKVYGAVPPVTVKFTIPSATPLHAKFVTAVAALNAAAGCVMVIDVKAVQPLPSVTVRL